MDEQARKGTNSGGMMESGAKRGVMSIGGMNIK
jgi:hypothetical protein